VSRLRGLGRRILEAAPGSLDLGVGGTVAPRPRLGGGRRELGDVKPNNAARRAMKSPERSAASACADSPRQIAAAEIQREYMSNPLLPQFKLLSALKFRLRELCRPADPKLS
jgi:hypothetical protein